MPSKAAVFNTVRDFQGRYIYTDADNLDIVSVWAIGTWCFSPEAVNPATYPYLYITAPKGSAKTLWGQDVLGDITRQHISTVGITGSGVFRLMGDIDPETGEVVTVAPTLAIDEIDATYSGASDEKLRQMLNAGYKRGATVPRTFGKSTYSFPVYSPKILMGIDNGHLPDTVLDRSIRIDLHRATAAQMATVEPFYSFDTEEEAQEIRASLAEWARDNSLVLRDYRPEPIPDLSPRQWEIARTLVQLAKALGIEKRIRDALHRVMTRNPERPDAKVSLYKAISGLFQDLGEDRATTRQILDRLAEDGVSVPGNSGKGLAAVLSDDGVAPDYIRFRKDHPGYVDDKPIQRGYFRHKFDGPFFRYLEDEDED